MGMDGSDTDPQHDEDLHLLYARNLNNLLFQLAEITGALCRDDPFLQDIPANVSHDELRYLLEAAEGGGLSLTVRRKNGIQTDVVLSKDSTVGDLKSLIEYRTSVEEEPAMAPRKISWRYIWKRYHLVCDNIRLSNSDVLLRDYGLKNGSVVTFGRTLVVRERKGRQRQPRQHNN